MSNELKVSFYLKRVHIPEHSRSLSRVNPQSKFKGTQPELG